MTMCDPDWIDPGDDDVVQFPRSPEALLSALWLTIRPIIGSQPQEKQ